MDIIDSKYIGLVSSRLQKFKRGKADLYNFRCPICGDSKKHKNKARGYLYPLKADMNFKCHNCGASSTFNNFLKTIDSTLHKQYVLEKFKERNVGKGSIIPEPKFDFKKPVFKKKLDLPKAVDVKIAKEYLEKRKLDPSKFYFASKFKEWTNKQKQTFDTIGREECRIVIPMYDTDHDLIGFQGRSLGPNSVKYITVMIKDDVPKLYGLEKVDKSKPVFVVEGPFDSTLINNSIAMCGADIGSSYLDEYDLIYVYDNEPRNREICDRISKCIEGGNQIVIWPSTINEKDINDMVMSGHNVMNLLESNTYSGLKAKIKFNNWKKI